MDYIVAELLARKKWDAAPTWKKCCYVICGIAMRIWKPLLIGAGFIAIIRFIIFG